MPDWAMSGDPTSGFNEKIRRYEVKRHGGKLSTNSLNRWDNETRPGFLRIADLMEGSCMEFQRHFGYA
jgi:hypothetical protein